MGITGFKPQLDRTQRYAVGLRIEGGGFTPLHSYASEEQLEEGLRDFYNMAVERGLHRPLAVEKNDSETEWDGAGCTTMPELTSRIMDEEDQKRDSTK